jgi:hypothetical protein
MRESVLPNSDFFGEYGPNSIYTANPYSTLAPFFSMRKLRLVFNELTSSAEFEFATFDAFKQQVLNSPAPQLELNKWQAISARR